MRHVRPDTRSEYALGVVARHPATRESWPTTCVRTRGVFTAAAAGAAPMTTATTATSVTKPAKYTGFVTRRANEAARRPRVDAVRAAAATQSAPDRKQREDDGELGECDRGAERVARAAAEGPAGEGGGEHPDDGGGAGCGESGERVGCRYGDGKGDECGERDRRSVGMEHRAETVGAGGRGCARVKEGGPARGRAGHDECPERVDLVERRERAEHEKRPGDEGECAEHARRRVAHRGEPPLAAGPHAE